jgi:uncharacterized membrane protein YhhN
LWSVIGALYHGPTGTQKIAPVRFARLMNTLTIMASLWTALAVTALVLAERAHNQRGVWIAKPLASLGFLATAYAAGAGDSIYGNNLLLGLGACAFGDLLLIPRGAKAWFIFGMLSFAAGHGAYAVAFARYGISDKGTLFALAPMVIVAILTLRWLGPHLPVLMHSPIRIYIAVISVMTALAVGATVASGQWLIAAGAITFAISDLFVARERFVQPDFRNQLLGLPLSYGAHLLLAYSVIGAT